MAVSFRHWFFLFQATTFPTVLVSSLNNWFPLTYAQLATATAQSSSNIDHRISPCCVCVCVCVHWNSKMSGHEKWTKYLFRKKERKKREIKQTKSSSQVFFFLLLGEHQHCISWLRWRRNARRDEQRSRHLMNRLLVRPCYAVAILTSTSCLPACLPIITPSASTLRTLRDLNLSIFLTKWLSSPLLSNSSFLHAPDETRIRFVSS